MQIKDSTVFSKMIMPSDNMSVCFIPPYTPLLYGKTGVYRGIFTGVYIIFLFLLLNIDCGYSLEPPH